VLFQKPEYVLDGESSKVHQTQFCQRYSFRPCPLAEIHEKPGVILVKVKFAVQQGVENGAEFPPERRFFTERYRRICMTRDRQRIDQIQNGFAAFENTLVYCFSELLDWNFLDRLAFTGNSTFC
jgi:hypothetical protein